MTTEKKTTDAILATTKWPTNAELIADCAKLGYLRDEWRTLDPTFGRGTFWKRWRPTDLVGSDIDATKSPAGTSVDFRHLPYEDRSFDCVVFDPDYKLNGTPDPAVDERYGTHEKMRWQDRVAKIRAGVHECVRVLGDGYLLVKTQDQVCSGKVRWLTLDVIASAAIEGLGLVDRLDMLSYRAQPDGRRQVHARRNASTMLVFKRGWQWAPIIHGDETSDTDSIDGASDLADIPDDELWAELERRRAAILCGYTYPAMASSDEATALIHEHGYEFGPWQHIELEERLARPPQWQMFARVPLVFPRGAPGVNGVLCGVKRLLS